MNREIEDGMGFAGLVGETADEREIERMRRKIAKMREALRAAEQCIGELPPTQARVECMQMVQAAAK